MIFNFKLFGALAARAYYKADIPYSLNDVLSVFEYYFTEYEAAFNRAHPNIRMTQIERIIAAMPYINDVHGSVCDIEPEEYKTLIDGHFQTRYRDCDYNINHFFSGDIRMLRLYEGPC